MVDDIRNEGWFKPDAITLDCIFRITPVGVKHAIDRYYELRSLFNTDDCQVDDILSTVAVKEDGTIDYEMLAITLQQESSELNRKCRVEDKKVQYISLLSGKKMISLLIRLKPQ